MRCKDFQTKRAQNSPGIGPEPGFVYQKRYSWNLPFSESAVCECCSASESEPFHIRAVETRHHGSVRNTQSVCELWGSEPERGVEFRFLSRQKLNNELQLIHFFPETPQPFLDLSVLRFSYVRAFSFFLPSSLLMVKTCCCLFLPTCAERGTFGGFRARTASAPRL